MSFIKKLKILNFFDDINKRTRILNNTSKVYNNLLDRYKDEYFEKYRQYK